MQTFYFRNENIVNYCITAIIVHNGGRKTEVHDEFDVVAPRIIKKRINESFKVSFCACAPMHDSRCLTNMTQIYV